jgi:hypothetical protein
MIGSTFSTNDGANLGTSSLGTGFVYSSEGDTVPFLLDNLDIPIHLEIQCMEGTHPYMMILFSNLPSYMHGRSNSLLRTCRTGRGG